MAADATLGDVGIPKETAFSSTEMNVKSSKGLNGPIDPVEGSRASGPSQR